jgi:hypothetical protein
MALEKRTTTINERSYQLLLPAVRQAMPLCTKVAVLLGPVLATLGQQAGNDGLEKLGAALRDVDPAKADALFMEAVRVSHLCYNGQPISDELDFEKHFDQYRGDTYQVCLWALWESVKDFFPQLGAFTRQMDLKAALASASPKVGP